VTSSDSTESPESLESRDSSESPDNPESLEIWVLRHGRTAWSEASRHTGRTDVPLTADGEAQARALAGRLAVVDFDVVLVSPLQRALHTAQLAGLSHLEVEPLAVEWDYGDYEGLTRAQIQASVPGWNAWTHPKMPGGESLEDVAGRARAVLDRLRREARRALVVAHGHFLRVLATQWMEQDASLGMRLRLAPGGIGVLGDDRGISVVQRWNV
jgi:probable phosphoglycerate mutase